MILGSCLGLVVLTRLCRVSYEPSYLPFLFPGLEKDSNTSMHTTAAVIKTNPASESDDSHESGELEPSIVYKGRRKFGKHGREEIEVCVLALLAGEI